MTSPIIGFVCNSTGNKVAYSISKKSTIALIYAVRHKGHFGISINKTVERNDIEPFAASTFLGVCNLVLQQPVFVISIARNYHFDR